MRIATKNGYRLGIGEDGVPFCDERDDTLRTAEFRKQAESYLGGTVAWIGGGFCTGPKQFDGFTQTVYEIQPGMCEFCPPGVTFIPGDYRETLTGLYDVICYDLGGDIPRDMLATHLNPGGVILPMED